MTTKFKKKNSKRKAKKGAAIFIMLIVSLVVFASVYAATATTPGKHVVQSFRLWLGSEQQELTPPENKDEPDPGSKPGEEPGQEPGNEEPGTEEPGQGPGKEEPDTEDPGQKPGEEEPDTEEPGNGNPDPAIYTGQVLIIPAAEGGGLNAAQVINNGTLPSSKKQIALTFDAGWLYDQTIPLLNVLDDYGVKATFFPRALWVQDNPDLGREIVKRGHVMGNHSLTHANMKELSAQQMRHEMQESTRIIRDVTGVKPYLFRPPYGEYNQLLLEILSETGYPYSIMWTVDTLDWTAGTTRNVGGKQTYIDVDFIVNRVLNNASDKGIILMHIGGASTVQALPRIIEGLQNKGYQLVTVDQMLPRPGSGTINHTVKSGETLFSIAQRYGVSMQQIIEINNL